MSRWTWSLQTTGNRIALAALACWLAWFALPAALAVLVGVLTYVLVTLLVRRSTEDA